MRDYSPPTFVTTRHAVRTGAFVVCAVALVAGLSIFLNMARRAGGTKRFGLFLEHAAGVSIGTHVTLAGVDVGEVTAIEVPVPTSERPQMPDGSPSPYEVRVIFEVLKDARIFRQSKISVAAQSFLGGSTIDFTAGDERSGVAEPGWNFVGPRREPTVDLREVLDKLGKSRGATPDAAPGTKTPR